MNDLNRIRKTFEDLFPINRSITGKGVLETFEYIKHNFLPAAEIKSIKSGTKIFDWEIPDEWEIADGYVKNSFGEKIINFQENNLHIISHSCPIDKVVQEKELLDHLYTLPTYPNWTPYRTAYYQKTWGFCCPHNLLKSKKFKGPFEVYIDSVHKKNGKLNWLECVKHGQLDDEILISTYCCHPSLANDNLSGIVLAAFLFEYLAKIDTRYTYRLVIVPETIGAISFLNQANTASIIGGMILSCVAGPDKISIKEGFDCNHWINKAAHLAIKRTVGEDYITYPFAPDGSDERQYSTPGFRIVTPSIHKSKYYEFEEYHTSADNLKFISSGSLKEMINVHKEWINLIESYCHPKRIQPFCEFQLGKRDLYPSIGGTLNQRAHIDNSKGSVNRTFDFNKQVILKGAHLNAFDWLMHLSDGSISNFEISEKSGIDIDVISESIAAMYQNNLLELL